MYREISEYTTDFLLGVDAGGNLGLNSGMHHSGLGDDK
jgi:hypothetical protein